MAVTKTRRPQPRRNLADSSLGVEDEPTRRALVSLSEAISDLQRRLQKLEGS